MIQIEPSARLGNNLESTQILKQHPFFAGIDFDEISKKDYDGNLKPVLALFDKLGINENDPYD